MDEQKKSTGSSSPVQKVKVGGWRRVVGKTWIFPAMYLGAAAIILAGVMWYQNSKDFTTNPATPQAAPQQNSEPMKVAQGGSEQPAVPVQALDDKLGWPAKQETTQKVMGFFDDASDKKEQEAALVQYDNSYWPNTGIAIAAKDKKTFEVTASAAGKVVKAERDPMLGYQVEIEHKDGISTVYASLEDTKVNVGDTVDRGAVLGMAGRNVFEKDLGIHLHFEVHKNGEAVEPEKYLPKAENAAQAK